jgi:mRNA capping enzyme, beta chain
VTITDEASCGALFQARKKDRMSYRVEDDYAVDLTRVDTELIKITPPNTNSSNNGRADAPATTFEVEIELLDAMKPPSYSAQLLLTCIRSLISLQPAL